MTASARVVLIGSGSVGPTCLSSRSQGHDFTQTYQATIGAGQSVYSAKLDREPLELPHLGRRGKLCELCLRRRRWTSPIGTTRSANACATRSAASSAPAWANGQTITDLTARLHPQEQLSMLRGSSAWRSPARQPSHAASTGRRPRTAHGPLLTGAVAPAHGLSTKRFCHSFLRIAPFLRRFREVAGR
jgi:hypothetical protein